MTQKAPLQLKYAACGAICVICLCLSRLPLLLMMTSVSIISNVLVRMMSDPSGMAGIRVTILNVMPVDNLAVVMLA